MYVDSSFQSLILRREQRHAAGSICKMRVLDIRCGATVRIGFEIDLQPLSAKWTLELILDLYFIVECVLPPVTHVSSLPRTNCGRSALALNFRVVPAALASTSGQATSMKTVSLRCAQKKSRDSTRRAGFSSMCSRVFRRATSRRSSRRRDQQIPRFLLQILKCSRSCAYCGWRSFCGSGD